MVTPFCKGVPGTVDRVGWLEGLADSVFFCPCVADELFVESYSIQRIEREILIAR